MVPAEIKDSNKSLLSGTIFKFGLHSRCVLPNKKLFLQRGWFSDMNLIHRYIPHGFQMFFLPPIFLSSTQTERHRPFSRCMNKYSQSGTLSPHQLSSGCKKLIWPIFSQAMFHVAISRVTRTCAAVHAPREAQESAVCRCVTCDSAVCGQLSFSRDAMHARRRCQVRDPLLGLGTQPCALRRRRSGKRHHNWKNRKEHQHHSDGHWYALVEQT